MKRLIFILIIFSNLIIYSQTSEIKWHTDLSKVVPISIKQDKPILLFFTGSDWCGWCRRLQSEVFAFKQFIDWSNENVILVELDFPRRKQLPAPLLQQNRELARVFGVSGYPTIWIVTPQIIEENKVNFNKLGSLGYVAGGPDKWINVANNFISK